MKNRFIAFILLLVVLVPASASGERIVKVGLYLNGPFVFRTDDGSYSGMAFNLWEAAAKRLGVQSEYFVYDSIKKLIEDAESGEMDLLVCNLSVTGERAERITFSFPWYDDGLRILVKSSGGTVTTWDVLRMRGQTAIFGWIGILILSLVVIQLLLRRRKDTSFPSCWVEGTSLSLYDVVRFTKGGAFQKNLFGWVGYLMLTVWMVCGFVLLVYVTATLSSAMTIAGTQRTHEINSLNDLSGKRVVVLVHSVGESYMRETGARLLLAKSLAEGVDMLNVGKADAVVWASAELEYWVHSQPHMEVEVVGNIFNPFKYSFAASKDSLSFMSEVSREIIRLLGDGTVEKLRDKYFGTVRF